MKCFLKISNRVDKVFFSAFGGKFPHFSAVAVVVRVAQPSVQFLTESIDFDFEIKCNQTNVVFIFRLSFR